MLYPRLLPGFRRIALVVLLCCLSPTGKKLFAQTPAASAPPQDPQAKTDSNDKPPPPPAAGDNQEVSRRDTPATFKVRVNLVLVRVVVRDAQGKIVPGLKKEDFQLFDSRKLQTITAFSVETPETRAVPVVTSPGADPGPSPSTGPSG